MNKAAEAVKGKEDSLKGWEASLSDGNESEHRL